MDCPAFADLFTISPEEEADVRTNNSSIHKLWEDDEVYPDNSSDSDDSFLPTISKFANRRMNATVSRLEELLSSRHVEERKCIIHKLKKIVTE